MNILGLLLGLAVLSILIYKRVPGIFSALIASLVVAAFNVLDPWEALTHLFDGIGQTFGTYFGIFFFATIYGKLMSDTGCANAIADYLSKVFGKDSVILIISITTAILVYGGVTAMVVAFTVFPIGVNLIRKADIPKSLLPGMIQLGQATFALTALPGTPQLNNLIPGKYFSTPSTSAPLLGIIASLIMFGLGYWYLKYEIKKAKSNGEHFDENTLRKGSVPEMEASEYPSTILAFMPIILLLVVYMIFDRITFNGYSMKAYNAFGPICTAMIVSIIYLMILGFFRNQKNIIINSLRLGATEFVDPLLGFAIVVGFGSVIKNTEGYAILVNYVTNLDMNPYLSSALSIMALAGVTGSASGGISIALSSEQLVASWTSKLAAPQQLEALHRIISVSSCSLDSLPHCGGVLATLDICQETHQTAYKHIFVITVVNTLIASFVIVALAMLGFLA